MTVATMTVAELVHEILRKDFDIAPERLTDDAHLIHDFRVTDDGNDWQLIAALEEHLGIEIKDEWISAWLGLDTGAPADAGTVGYFIAQVTALGVAPKFGPDKGA